MFSNPWANASRISPAARHDPINRQPGGHIGLHSYKDRPAVVYFVQGTDTVIRDDGTSQTFHPGDTTGETGKTVHWHRNDGKDAVIAITADIFKTDK